MPPEDCPLKRDPAGWCRKGIFMEEALFKVLSFITFIMLGYLLRRLSILKAETFRFCIYLIMIVMAFLHLALPHPVIIFTKIAGDANAFLCMLMIGVNINLQMDSKSFRCLIKHITVRYALSAVLAFLFYRYLPFSLEIRQAMAVIALAPSSSLALIFTMKLKGDVIMAGNICSLSILLSTIAMTILLVYL